MNISLQKIIGKITLEQAIKIEENDSQFKSLKNLYENIKNKEFYLSLIVTNALICYQLSGSGENYWEEFKEFFIKNEIGDFEELKLIFPAFLKNSKNNKRLLNMKIKRLEKIFSFIEKEFLGNEKYLYENMEIFCEKMCENLKQKNDSKTIVFSIKMFSYGARNIYSNINYPFEIEIPIDSRLTKIYEKFNLGENIKDFYNNLSKDLNISPLLLDAVLWTNFEEIMKSKI